jgi:hypothetical protein
MTYCNPLQYSGHRPSSQAPVRIFPYLALGAVSAYLTIYAFNHNCQPSAKLDRLNDATTIVKGILAYVEGKRMRDYLVLAATETRFLRYVIPVAASGTESSNLTGSGQDQACSI